MDPTDLTEAAAGPHVEQRILAGILQHYAPDLARASARVAGTMAQAGLAPVDGTALREITYRHALVFYAGANALGVAGGLEDIVCGALLAYSFPLVVVDTAIDQPSRAPGEAMRGDRLAVSHAMTHLGYAQLAQAPLPSGWAEHVARIGLMVTMGMHRDLSRQSFHLPALTASDVTRYWSEPTSRLNGSGVARLMLGLAAIAAEGEETEDIRIVGTRMGQMRQLADELLDVVEDARAGLITLPMVYALTDPETSVEARAALAQLWRPMAGAATARAEAVLRELVLRSGAAAAIRHGADRLLWEATQAARRAFPQPEHVEALLLQRRLQVDRAIEQGLTDDQGGHDVDGLLALAGCDGWLAEAAQLLRKYQPGIQV